MTTHRIIASLLAWATAWCFWLSMTYQFHPTILLAFIVTTSLIVAYAMAFYCNHLILVPQIWTRRGIVAYIASLSLIMAVLTAIALAIIRVSYFQLHGPDADPYGAYKHFAIDYLGMVVHVAIAAKIVWITNRYNQKRS